MSSFLRIVYWFCGFFLCFLVVSAIHSEDPVTLSCFTIMDGTEYKIVYCSFLNLDGKKGAAGEWRRTWWRRMVGDCLSFLQSSVRIS